MKNKIDKNRLHHIGLLVYNIENFSQFLSLIGWRLTGKAYNRDHGVMTFFFQHDIGVQIELLVPKKNPALSKSLRRNGNHIHHLAFEVENIRDVIKKYKKAGYRFLGSRVSAGFKNRKTIFVDPLSSKGILVELIS